MNRPHGYRFSCSLVAEARYLVGIPQEFTGRGVGARPFQEVETWTRNAAVHRSELKVMTHNEAGIAIYGKLGSQIEGTRRAAL